MKRSHRRRPPKQVPFMTAPARDEMIMALHGQGFSLRTIAEAVGMSPNGVMHAIRRIQSGGGSGRDPRP